MISTIRKTAVTVGALGALGLGGAAIAGAAGTPTATPTPTTRPQREALSADVAAKVKAAALAKVPGATVDRTEAGGPDGAAYHAHITTSGGTKQVVLVDASFKATDVVAEQGRGGRGHGGGKHGNETALTGDTKSKVEAAVLAKYPGATIERTETNSDSSAPYESHITTKDGKHLEVTVSKDFAVVAANEGRGGGGRGHGGGKHGNETALTGDTKSKVEAAVLAKYPGATIERTETNSDSSDAPYESHITTKDGKHLEVTVSKTFAVVAANEHHR